MKKILRITTVSHSLDLLLKGQLKYVGENGFDVHIACSEDESVYNIEKRENVKYHKLKLTRTLNPFRDLISLFQAILLIKKIKPEIVHSHSPKAGIIGMLAASFCNVPTKIHTVAGLPLTEAEGLKKMLLIQVERITYYCADIVLSNSIKQKEYITKYIFNGEKVQVLGKGSSNGIDLSYFNEEAVDKVLIRKVKEDYGIDSNTKVLCFVGRLTNYKGVNELVKAFGKIEKQYDNIKLLLVGPYERLNPLGKNILKEINCNKNIITTGHVNDIRPYLKVSDIFVFPSHREGFPQSLMQAAAMNLACIATNINGCNEILTDKISGLLFESKNEKSLLDTINKLIQDDNLRKFLAKNARKKMELFFEQKSFWDLLLNIYRK